MVFVRFAGFDYLFLFLKPRDNPNEHIAWVCRLFGDMNSRTVTTHYGVEYPKQNENYTYSPHFEYDVGSNNYSKRVLSARHASSFAARSSTVTPRLFSGYTYYSLPPVALVFLSMTGSVRLHVRLRRFFIF